MKKLVFHRKFWIAAAVLWTLFIWSNSLQTAAESSHQSSGMLELLAPLLAWSGLPVELWHTVIRKLAHMMEFALLGLLWARALRPMQNADSEIVCGRLGWVLVICLLTALADETIQLFVPGRSGEIRDMWIDFSGGVVGVLAVDLMIRIEQYFVTKSGWFMKRKYISMYSRFFKRLIDIILSLMGIIALAVPMLIVALIIKIDSPGPVFFLQKRVGIHKTHFNIIKFRSMSVKAPRDMPTHQLEHVNNYLTKWQRFIRKSSIDELPQMFNILSGSMSIIGDGCIIETTRKSIDFSRVVTV